MSRLPSAQLKRTNCIKSCMKLRLRKVWNFVKFHALFLAFEFAFFCSILAKKLVHKQMLLKKKCTLCIKMAKKNNKCSIYY